MKIIFMTLLFVLVASFHYVNSLPNRQHRHLKLKLLEKYLEKATSSDYQEADKQQRNRGVRGVLEEIYRWPNAIVPYHIWTKSGKGSFEANGKSYKLIKSAMKDIERVSCIRFKELQYSQLEKLPKENYLIIFAAEKSKCRTVSPGYGLGTAMFLKDALTQSTDPDSHCMKRPTIIHELFHVLGFVHEHQRNDRDKYVKVLTENIKQEHLQSFDVYKSFRRSMTIGAKYDRLSIMHYHETAFSKNGKKTIVWKADETLSLGGDKMSTIDKLQLNTYYQCKGFPTLAPSLMKTQETGRSTVTSVADCPKDLCKNVDKLHGLIAHRHIKNTYVNCYFGMNFGCYQCPDNHEFHEVDKKCAWKPNTNLS